MRWIRYALVGLAALCFFEQLGYRFSHDYATWKRETLVDSKEESGWFHAVFRWAPLDAWASPPVPSGVEVSDERESKETAYSRKRLSHLRPLRDDLYEALINRSVDLSDVLGGKTSLDGVTLLEPKNPEKVFARGVVLLLLGPDWTSVGGGLREEIGVVLGTGVSCALARVDHFGAALDAVGALRGPSWEPRRAVATCAYGEEAGHLALALANRPDGFAAAAVLSPVGVVREERWAEANYPPVLFAARAADLPETRNNALSWSAHCRERTTGAGKGEILGMVAPSGREERYVDVKLKTYVYAFLLEALKKAGASSSE